MSSDITSHAFHKLFLNLHLSWKLLCDQFKKSKFIYTWLDLKLDQSLWSHLIKLKYLKQTEQKLLYNPNRVAAGYLQRVAEDLNRGLPWGKSSNWSERDSNGASRLWVCASNHSTTHTASIMSMLGEISDSACQKQITAFYVASVQ